MGSESFVSVLRVPAPGTTVETMKCLMKRELPEREDAPDPDSVKLQHQP